MGRTAKGITDTELSLLNELWQRSSATTQELTRAYYGNTTPALLATVRKLLDRLEAKKCVTCNRTKWPCSYRAVVEREDLADIRLQEVADQLYEGDLTPLLTRLVRLQMLSPMGRENLPKQLNEIRMACKRTT
jgi:BlaI family transcriptional regulator, penicillinase repressor